MGKILIWTVCIAFAVYLVSSIANFNPSGASVSERRETEPDCGDRSEAWVYAQEFIERKLKNPRSAKFAWSSGSDGVSIHQEGCNWTVASYVDATNSFGGSMRTQWVITIKKVSDGWIALDGPNFF